MTFAAGLPDSVKARLRSTALTAAGEISSSGRDVLSAQLFGDTGGLPSAAAVLALELGALDDRTITKYVLSALAGGKQRRLWAARLARRMERADGIGVLLALVDDLIPEVRASAAAGLAHLIAEGKGGTTAVEGVLHCLEDPGANVPYALAVILSEATLRDDTTEQVLDRLRNSLSARVRRVADQAAA